ncbi:MAG: hypothetical protein M3H12_01760, partial [Chromatiales bacterium]
SRRPVQEMSKEQIFQCAVLDDIAEEIDSVDPQIYVNVSEPRITQIRQASAADDTLQQLLSTVMSGWPEHRHLLPHELKPYWTFQEEISAHDGILYKRAKNDYPKALPERPADAIIQQSSRN